MQKVAIFIDFDNYYIGLKNNYMTKDCLDIAVTTIAKIREKYKDDKILTIKAYADFNNINNIITDMQLERIELRHVYSSHNGRKNASDIALTIDIIKSLYSKQDIDKYVLVSSDIDMLPIVNELQYFAKDVEVIYIEATATKDYQAYLHCPCDTIENIAGLNQQLILTNMELNNPTFMILRLNEINSVMKMYAKPPLTALTVHTLVSALVEMTSYTNNNWYKIINTFIKRKILLEFFVSNCSSKSNFLQINPTILKELDWTLQESIVMYSRYFKEEYHQITEYTNSNKIDVKD